MMVTTNTMRMKTFFFCSCTQNMSFHFFNFISDLWFWFPGLLIHRKGDWIRADGSLQLSVYNLQCSSILVNFAADSGSVHSGENPLVPGCLEDIH